jgi:cyclopropane-fatty-acyl-phospholipid synthase
MAIWAASRHGCRVTTTTISREQREYAEARVRAAGLEDRITVLGSDYRDLSGTYDKLVSIEMIEAVGWEYFDLYFKRCAELLGPRGLFLCQAIVVDDRGFEAEKASRSFAMELIFPGGCLPSREAIARSVAGATDLRTVWLDDISDSYALTLAEWRRRFLAAAPKLGELGYDERFRRIWEIWLATSEAGFREARISDLQILMAKPEWRGRIDVARSQEGTGESSRGEETDAIGSQDVGS